MSKRMPIGALSRATGVKVPTIRYYEQVGLLPEPPRTRSDRRTYDEAAIKRLRFIRHARELGFDVDAIRQLLDLSDQPQRSCAEVDAIARRHLEEITSRLAGAEGGGGTHDFTMRPREGRRMSYSGRAFPS